MASDNRLVGAGKTYNEDEVQQIVKNFDPLWLYHKDQLKGQVVKDRKTYTELIEAGWEDHPGKCALLSGHEAMFKGEEIFEEKKGKEKGVIGKSKSKSKSIFETPNKEPDE